MVSSVFRRHWLFTFIAGPLTSILSLMLFIVGAMAANRATSSRVGIAGAAPNRVMVMKAAWLAKS